MIHLKNLVFLFTVLYVSAACTHTAKRGKVKHQTMRDESSDRQMATAPKKNPCKDPDEINDILAFFTSLDKRDHKGNTKLHWTAKCGYIAETQAILNATGTSLLHVRNHSLELPLHEAAGSGHMEVTEMLIYAETDLEYRQAMLDAKNIVGETSSLEAAERCQGGTLAILKQAGADLTIRSDEGDLPFDAAVKDDCSKAVLDIAYVHDAGVRDRIDVRGIEHVI